MRNRPSWLLALCLLLTSAAVAAPLQEKKSSLEDAVNGGKSSTPFGNAGPASPKKPSTKRTARSARPAAKAAPRRVTLDEGLEVPLEFAEEISSKTADEGDAVKLLLAEDLRVDGIVVAKAGTEANGIVSDAEKAGWLGKDAKLQVKLQALTIDGVEVKLRGKKTKDGDDSEGVGEAVDVAKGIFKKGENVKIKPGTRITGYVDEPVTLTVAPK